MQPCCNRAACDVKCNTHSHTAEHEPSEIRTGCGCGCGLANSWQLVTHAPHTRTRTQMMPHASLRASSLPLSAQRHFACPRRPLCADGGTPRGSSSIRRHAVVFRCTSARAHSHGTFAIYASSDLVTDLKWSSAKSRCAYFARARLGAAAVVTSTEKNDKFTRRRRRLFRA